MIGSLLITLWLGVGLLFVLAMQWAINHPDEADMSRLEHDLIRRQFALTAMIMLLLGPLALLMVKVQVKR